MLNVYVVNKRSFCLKNQISVPKRPTLFRTLFKLVLAALPLKDTCHTFPSSHRLDSIQELIAS